MQTTQHFVVQTTQHFAVQATFHGTNNTTFRGTNNISQYKQHNISRYKQLKISWYKQHNISRYKQHFTIDNTERTSVLYYLWFHATNDTTFHGTNDTISGTNNTTFHGRNSATLCRLASQEMHGLLTWLYQECQPDCLLFWCRCMYIGHWLQICITFSTSLFIHNYPSMFVILVRWFIIVGASLSDQCIADLMSWYTSHG